MKTLTVYIMDDTTPEDDEVMFVYLNPVTEGVRVALPSRDADKMVITHYISSMELKNFEMT